MAVAVAVAEAEAGSGHMAAGFPFLPAHHSAYIPLCIPTVTNNLTNRVLTPPTTAVNTELDFTVSLKISTLESRYQ